MNKLSTERAIETLYTIRGYYASLTAGYPKGRDCKGIDDVTCSEIANSCLMAIKALEQPKWIPVSERLPEESGNYWCTFSGTNLTGRDYYTTESDAKELFDNPEEFTGWQSHNVIAWMPLPKPYKAENED